MSSAPPRYFVILGAMRTGSNLFEEMLGSSDRIKTYGEAFNPGFAGQAGQDSQAGWSCERRDRDPLGCLDALIDDAGECLAGFRLFAGHSAVVRSHVLGDPRCARFVLRRDPLGSYVSLKIAQDTGQWLVRDAQHRRPRRIRFDVAEFADYRRRDEAYFQDITDRMEMAGTKALSLSFQNLTAPDTLRQAEAHLRLPEGTIAARPSLVRQNPGPMWRKIANLEDLQAFAKAEGLEVPAAELDPYQDLSQAIRARAGELVDVSPDGVGRYAGLGIMEFLRGQSTELWPLGMMDLCRGQAFAEHYEIRGLRANDVPASQALFVIAHPAVRALFAFFSLVMDRGRGDRALREAVEAVAGPVARRRDLGRLVSDPTQITTLRRQITAYLDLVADTLAGAGGLITDRAWLSQRTLLTARQEAGLVVSPIRLEALAEAPQLGVATGRAPALTRLAQGFAAHVAEIMTPEIEERVQAIWPEDYAPLGYAPGDWPVSGTLGFSPD